MMACHFSFNLIDSIWVGRLIGPAALAAVSTAGFYVWVALSLGEMVEIGLIAVAARRHGEGDPERAARAAAAAVAYALVAGLVVSLAGWALAGTMFRVMTVPPEVATLGRAYLSTWLLGAPLVFGFFAIEATFRAAGDTSTPFVMLAGSRCAAVCCVSRRPTGAACPPSFASARRSRCRASCSRSSICGSPGLRPGSAPPRSRRLAWDIRWKDWASSRSAVSRWPPAHSSVRTSARGRRRGRGRPCG